MYELKDKVAVVTGAGSGIGRALAQLLAAKGCRLALADINEKGLAETAAMLKTEVITQKLDVADRAAVYAFAEKVKTKYGTAHVVINNAGVAVSQTVNDLTWEDFEWLMGINFWGVTYGTKAFLPMMLAQNEGVMVNISSVFGIIAVPTQSAYNAAKFAVRGFTESLWCELDGTGVTAISVHPGGIKTNIARDARSKATAAAKEQLSTEFAKVARTTPEEAAAVIMRGVYEKKRRVMIGADAQLIQLMLRLLPESYPSIIKALDRRPR